MGFYLLGCLFFWSLSSWKFGNMTFCSRLCVSTNGSLSSGFCSHLVLSTWVYVHEGIFVYEIMYTWHSVHLGVWLLGFWTLGSLPTWQSVHKVLCLRWGLSNLIRLTFSSLPFLIFSNLVFIFLDFVHFGVWPHDILSKSRLCPLLVLSTLDCAHFWLCLLGSQSTWVVAYLESVHLGVWLHDILPT